jgi:hypothetical protein
MRALITLLLVAFAAAGWAQSAARPRPPGTSPLESPPPLPPVAAETDPGLEPQVTVRNEDGQTVQEYRVRGKLFMVRVTPKHGRPYVMIDHKGNGQLARQDNLDSGVRVPQWVIAEF